jgi:predicted metal-dependent phosphoesterase TrpH
MSAADTVDAIHAQGGLAIAVHPYSFLLPGIVKGVQGHILSISFDAVEVCNATPTEWASNYLAAWRNRKGPRLAETGGSDAHYLPTIGRTSTLFSGRTASDFYRALQTGQVRASGRVYSMWTLARVAAFSLLGIMPVARPSTARQPVRQP